MNEKTNTFLSLVGAHIVIQHKETCHPECISLQNTTQKNCVISDVHMLCKKPNIFFIPQLVFPRRLNY